MVPAITYSSVLQSLEHAFESKYDNEERKKRVRMVGLVFARPGTDLVAREIVPHLGYFNERSGDKIDFFFMGYGIAAIPQEIRKDHQVALPEVRHGYGAWFFDDRAFTHAVVQVEAECRWAYSGVADLILVDASWRNGRRRIDLDFSHALAVDLAKAREDGAITSIERFFEQIFRFAAKAPDTDPTRGFSTSSTLAAGRNSFIDVVLSLLPRGIGAEVKKAPHFMTSDLGLE